MNPTIQFINNNNRGQLMKIDKYLFCKNRSLENKHYWKCINWRNRCNGRAQTEQNGSRHILINASEHVCKTGISKPEPIVKSDVSNKLIGNGNINEEFVERKHMQFKHPFTCMVAGPTSSGKTVLVRRIIKDYDKTFYFRNECPSPLKVLWAYGQWQSLYEEKLDKCEIQYIDGLPSESDVKKFMPNLIVIDDLMSELSSDKKLTNLFTKGSHHLNISILFISQNIFYKGAEMRTVNLNCHYTILMNNPNDLSQIRTLASRRYPGNSGFLIEAFEDATKTQYGYIRLDSRLDTPAEYRVQTRITPDKKPINCPYTLSTIVYSPK